MENRGAFGVKGTGDTSGYGGLVRTTVKPGSSERPFGSYFDDVADDLERAFPSFHEAIERIVVDRGELTLFVKKEHIFSIAKALRDTETLRFEMCLSVSGVHYPEEKDRELHVVYHLLSMTYNRRIRVEVALPDSNPHIQSLVEVWGGTNWHERETWDMFGIIFDGHPALTRILMPDDWQGHPQRKDYPLGGIPVEYHGATTPPPENRRSYR